MPPSGQLPAGVVKDFEEWVRRGLPDPRPEPDAVPRKRYEPVTAGELWSFRPVVEPAVPEIADAAWPVSQIDRFVSSGLAEAGLRPLGDAAPRVLVRRLFLDLVGLPPSPEESAAWVERLEAAGGAAERRADVVGALADELLGRPQFGERWGRHWLDTARYADSNGNNRNRVLRQAWRYRNWVIDALNADKSYDEFLKEQLAGDLMPSDSRSDRDGRRIATGFLAVGPKPYYPTIVPVDPEEPDRARFDWAAEQINAVGSGMLGLTVGCARCHDHKFDPIPTRDYYAMAGIFRSTDPKFGMYWDLFGVDEGQAQRDFLYDFNLLVLNDESLPEMQSRQAAYRPLVIEQNQIDLRSRHWPGQIERLETKLADKDFSGPAAETARKQIEEKRRTLAADAVRLTELLAEKERLRAAFDLKVDVAMGVEDAAEPADVHVRVAGEHADRGELVPRGFLSTLTFDGAPVGIDAATSGRLQLAEWVAHPNNPLTARVAVNRVWHHLFGRGLVATADNFGAGGETPSNPDLLDHLAWRFVHELDWSVKRLIRELVRSRVYGLQSSENGAEARHFAADPGNLLLWRSTPRRVDAETMRDAMLMVCGRLDLLRPQGSVTEGFEYYADIRHEDIRDAHELLAGNRRTVYVPTLRGHRHALYDLFDYPDDESVNSVRAASHVPTQSLFLLNNPLVAGYAASLSERAEAEGGADRLGRLYELCFSRAPTGAERSADAKFLGETPSPEDWRRLAHSMLISAEFLYRF